MKNIATALVKAQREFGPALKSSTNPHFKSKYADLAACVEAVIDGLNNNGIALVQPMHESENGVTVETLFVHESGEMLSAGKLHVPAAKQDPQGYGSALTYARRYSLMAACGIAPEDDDGNAAKGPKKAGAPQPVTPPKNGAMADTLAQLPKLSKEWQDYFDNLAADVCDQFGVQKDTGAALTHIDAQDLSNEQKLQLWARLPSAVRSALDKAETERREERAAA